MSPAIKIVLRGAIALGAIGLGVAVFAGLVSSKPEPQERAKGDNSLLVEVAVARKSSPKISIEVQGVVVPAEQVSIQSEVVGRVVWANPKLTAGGRVGKGDVLVRIDARDYRLRARQAAADIERTRVTLDLERGRKQIAEREWKLLGGDTKNGAGRARALREPQIRAAENAVEAAKSGLDLARLMVAKSVIRAPFNAIVISESVAKGQLVSPQLPIAVLVQSDRFHVQASVPTAQIQAIRIPGVNAEPGAGSKASIRHDTGNGVIRASGTTERLLGDLDVAGQMARVVIGVDDPLALEHKDRSPLLLGSHVMIKIDSGTLENVFSVPRLALRRASNVYVFDDGKLAVKPVRILWRTPESVYVASGQPGGLEDGDSIVLSAITAPIPGMLLRIDSSSAAGSAAPSAARDSQ